LTAISEAQIHFELYRYLQNAIGAGFSYRGINIARVEPEYSKNIDGFADLVIFDNRERPWLVIEAKKKIAERLVRNIDPFSPEVVRQAHRYAGQLGSPYFATYNGAVLVLFKTDERFVPLLQRKTKSYLIKDVEKFASELLREMIDLEVGLGKWDPREDAFVTRLQEFHRRLFAQFSVIVEEKLGADKKFLQSFVKWIKDQGWENNERVHQSFARQASYLLMNKLIFYKILQSEPAYSGNVPSLDLRQMEISKQLRLAFDAVIKNIDFEAVFEQDPIFDEISLNSAMNEEVKELLHELGEFDLSKFGSDVIGRIYQNVLPPKERHDLGQYYTPPEVCDLITSLTIKDPYAHVLDPAVGSGGFAVKAYERLKTLKKEAGKPVCHSEIIGQIHAIDINRFPAHLTAINLALRDLSSRTENVDVEVSDFFDVVPQQKRMVVEKAFTKGKRAVEMSAPSKVDVVVGNPPYIRQERIEDKDKVRKHLQKLSLDGMSDRSDIYCYFYTHSSEFLKDGGSIGFITSNRWLTVGYGRDLQVFLLSNFKIRAIIAFDRQVFKEPLIGTVITILEKCTEELGRVNNVVRFLRFKRGMALEKIVEKVEQTYDRDLFYEDADLRLVTVEQKNLYEEDKWHKYLYAPALYFEVLLNKKITLLKDVARVSRGITSNANEFFYFKGKRAFEDQGIERFFVSPLIKHVRQTEFVNLKKEDTDWYVLDLHSLVQEILSGENKSVLEHSDTAEIVKKEMARRSYIGLLNYIKQGETKGINKKPALRSRRVWFDVGELPKPPIMFPEVYWKKAQVLYNEEGLTLDKRLYSIWPKDNVDPKTLLGILNSDLLLLMREIDGRIEEGQAMNRNSVMVYEAENLRILDPRQLSSDDANRIKKTLEEIIEKEREADEEKLRYLHRELNKAVLAPLGLEDRVGELEKIIGALLDARIRGGGVHAEVIIQVEGDGYQKIMGLRGAALEEERTKKRVTLDDFVRS
jgi:type I restriction-modification system DNA methylase subunit